MSWQALTSRPSPDTSSAFVNGDIASLHVQKNTGSQRHENQELFEVAQGPSPGMPRCSP
jgi:hypothetical protein